MKRRGANRALSNVLVRTIAPLLILCAIGYSATADGQIIQGERAKVISVSGGATKIQRTTQ